MRIQPGQRLLHYRIAEKIGEGGMGQVYRAWDSKLDRHVALKLLPPQWAQDRERRGRFEREARAVAALNHPNIVTVHSIEEAEGLHFITMELVQGRTLRSLIARGAVDRAEFLAIACPLTDAVSRAHAHGITHRDLKPENVMVDEDGRVRILDFGLAKKTGLAPGAGEATVTQLTDDHRVLGTLAYMSPEQASGQPVGPRSDVFSLGILLYEMAAGTRPLAEPAPIRHRDDLPPELFRIIERCLAKDPDKRFKDAGDLYAALRRVQLEEEAPPARRPALGWSVAALVVVVAAVAAWMIREGSRGTAQPVGSQPEPTFTRLTAKPQELPVYSANLSPDGAYLAYADESGSWLEHIASGDITELPLYLPSWFPDSTRIAGVCWDDNDDSPPAICTTTLLGGTPRVLRSDAWGPVVSPDGSRIVFQTNREGAGFRELRVIDADGGNEKLLAGDHRALSNASWSPSGRQIAYVQDAQDPRIEAVDPDSWQTTVVYQDPRLMDFNGQASVAWLPDGRLVFSLTEGDGSTSNLWSLAVDPDSGRPSGNPLQITTWRGATLGDLSVSKRGQLAFVETRHRVDVVVIDLADPAKPRVLSHSDRNDLPALWLPDGDLLLVSDGKGPCESFRWSVSDDVIHSEPVQPGNVFGAQVTPDGQWLLFWERDDEQTSCRPVWSWRQKRRLLRRPLGGGAPEVVLASPSSRAEIHCPVAAGGSCCLAQQEADEVVLYALDPIAGKGEELARVEARSGYVGFALSPSGDRAVIRSEGEPLIVDLVGGTPPERIDFDPGGTDASLAWARDGKGLFVTSFLESGGSGLVYYDLETKTVSEVLRSGGWVYHPVLSGDGRRVAVATQTHSANAWLMKDF